VALRFLSPMWFSVSLRLLVRQWTTLRTCDWAFTARCRHHRARINLFVVGQEIPRLRRYGQHVVVWNVGCCFAFLSLLTFQAKQKRGLSWHEREDCALFSHVAAREASLSLALCPGCLVDLHCGSVWFPGAVAAGVVVQSSDHPSDDCARILLRLIRSCVCCCCRGERYSQCRLWVPSSQLDCADTS